LRPLNHQNRSSKRISAATGPRIVHIDLEKLTKDARNKVDDTAAQSNYNKQKNNYNKAQSKPITSKNYQSQKLLVQQDKK
jgi:hypothetical protein